MSLGRYLGVGLFRVLPTVADKEDALDQALPEKGVGEVDRQSHKLVRIPQLLRCADARQAGEQQGVPRGGSVKSGERK